MWSSLVSAFGNIQHPHKYFMLYKMASRSSLSELTLANEYVKSGRIKSLTACPFCLRWGIFLFPPHQASILKVLMIVRNLASADLAAVRASVSVLAADSSL